MEIVNVFMKQLINQNVLNPVQGIVKLVQMEFV
jgi:hypothetical protein